MTHQIIHRLEKLFTGHVFAVFGLSFLFFVTSLLLVMLFAPVGETGFGAFAEDFKMWCFNYDPATGRVDVVYAAVMILNPLMLMGVVAGFWIDPLREALRKRRGSVALAVLSAATTVAVLVGGITLIDFSKSSTSNLPFPAERLRTDMTPTDFTLQNQDGDTVRLSDLKGKVVLLTAVYANCHTACPTIITQAKSAVAKLTEAERENLTIVAITLDPQNDTRERLAATADAHQLEAPFFHFVNGDDPQVVEDLLDSYSFSRIKDPETGVIDHANMFVLIDAEGLIAFRLNLSDRHANWLTQGLRVLSRETLPGSGATVARSTASPVE